MLNSIPKMDNGAQPKIKMSGYLYMKCKKRMMSSWKTYWFVLEDRLLLYYRSKDEYQAISPCKGSINLGPPCIVKSFPSVANAFQIETRTNTITLRTENSEEQMKWMQTIMSALNQNQNFASESSTKLNHFRYSLDDLIPENEPNDNRIRPAKLERQNTVPNEMTASPNSSEIIQRLQKIGAHSYGGSLGAITEMATKKIASPSSLKNKNRASQGSLPDDCRVNDESLISISQQHLSPTLRPRVCGNNIYERISGDSNSSQSDRNSFIVDNENYSVPVRKTSSLVCGHSGKNPGTRETKSLLIENDQYVTTQIADDAIYAEPKLSAIDHNKNSVMMENPFYDRTESKSSDENVYEDLEKYSHYSQPILKDDEAIYSQCSEERKSGHKTRQKTKEEKSKSLKKTRSFIRRVWHKRNKKQETEEEIYEVVKDDNVEKIELTNDSTVQMLSELQNILEHKKTLLKQTVSSNSSGAPASSEQITKASTSNSDLCPSLPPKLQKHHDKTNQSTNQEPLRSLDEILEDLNKEKLESKTKVKMLIEKFSESEADEVTLRKHDKADFKINRHSDELNKLLNELAKVTSAPIMTPGVTSSLVNPNLADEEWLKLLPVRQRRLSEPDYDVPRPHKSIQLPVKHENVDAIPVTRFFGPVLPPNISDNLIRKDESLVSITPDSLEMDDQPKSANNCSYTSHNYGKNEKSAKDLACLPQNHKKQDDNIIYAMPKSYLSVATHIVNTCQNICSAHLAEDCTIIYKNVKNVEVHDEIFNDSLELCNESSTEF